ncbi:hypothetical protein EIN_504220, partial [Entamoeba invadens IP1]
HQTDITILPSSPSMHLKYDTVSGEMTSESQFMYFHFGSGFPMPSHLIMKGVDKIEISVKRPSQVAYNYYRVKEYSPAIKSNTFTVIGDGLNSTYCEDLFLKLTGRKIGHFGKYDGSVFDPIHMTLLNTTLNSSIQENSFYHIEVEGEPSFDETYNITESFVSMNRTYLHGQSKIEELFNYMMTQLQYAQREWGITNNTFETTHVETILSFDFQSKVLNYSEVSEMYTDKIKLNTPKKNEDHERLLTFLTSCGTDVQTKEEVCKFTRLRKTDQNGQILSTPHVVRKYPKGSLLQQIVPPINNSFINYTIDVQPVFMNASCQHCDIYYVYSFPDVTYFTENDIKRMERARTGFVGKMNGTHRFVMFKRSQVGIIGTFKIHFHVTPQAKESVFTIGIPFIFQKCPVKCSEHFLLNHLWEYNKNATRKFDLIETSTINSLLYGCSDSSIDQIYDPFCNKQVLLSKTPTIIGWWDQVMQYKTLLIIYTTTIVGIAVLVVAFLVK